MQEPKTPEATLEELGIELQPGEEISFDTLEELNDNKGADDE